MRPPPPGHPVTASVLITNPSDELLIVHPAKPDAPWQLPGGLVEQDESPLEAAHREVVEELGLFIDLLECDLFAVEWLQATRIGRYDRIAILFAGPVLQSGDTNDIALQRDELDAWRWATHTEAKMLLHPAIAARIKGPLQTPNRPIYRETRYERTL
ncbi:NUDIX hydrolase [Streptomyces sp. NPDC048361]|uniref:NUDIX hydrolase n=1 Tax=Streptomyces sp. NPDC048361 TaxID=3154720 RepID=UPI00342C2D5F